MCAALLHTGDAMTFDEMRNRDIYKQGFAKRSPARSVTPRQRRIAEIKAALAGKRGYQSEWALGLLREELDTLK